MDNEIIGMRITIDVLISKDMLKKGNLQSIMNELKDNLTDYIDEDINLKVVGEKCEWIKK